jgi:hypothetical protein
MPVRLVRSARMFKWTHFLSSPIFTSTEALFNTVLHNVSLFRPDRFYVSDQCTSVRETTSFLSLQYGKSEICQNKHCSPYAKMLFVRYCRRQRKIDITGYGMIIIHERGSQICQLTGHLGFWVNDFMLVHYRIWICLVHSFEYTRGGCPTGGFKCVHTFRHTIVLEQVALTALSDKVSRALKNQNVAFLIGDCPLLSFEEVNALLPLCAQSWKHMTTTEISTISLDDLFQVCVIENLWRTEIGKETESKLSLNFRKGKNAINSITYAMKYCIRAKRRDQSYFKKKLPQLGREHSRIGVTSEVIVDFCNALVKSFRDCLETGWANYEGVDTDAISYAWAANFKFITSQMSDLRFCFLRVVSGEFFCYKCGEATTSCGCRESVSHTMSSDSAETPLVPSLSNNNLLFTKPDEYDHMCHTTFEGNSGKKCLTCSLQDRNFPIQLY